MPAIDPQTLLDEAKCYACYANTSLSEMLKLALLSRIATSGGGGVAAVWGEITGTLSNQTDLQSALAAGYQPLDADLTTLASNNGSNLAFSGNGAGIKHKRVTTGPIGAGSTALITVTWDTAFPDANYTPQASVTDSTTSSLALSVVHIESVAAGSITVRVLNNALGSLTGTVNAMAIHD